MFRLFLKWDVAAVLLIAATSVQANCEFDDFIFQEMHKDRVQERFEPAVLRLLTSTGERGTGFLIDAARGLVLTAAHVVYRVDLDDLEKDAEENGEIVGQSIASEGQITLRRISHGLELGQDLALLQLHPPDALSHVWDIDLATALPRRHDALVMGYPKETLEGGRTRFTSHEPQVFSVRIVSRGNGWRGLEGLTFADSAVFPGTSGSPLINANGIAVGIATTDVAGQGAFFTPLTNVGKLLSALDYPSDIDNFDRELRSGEISQTELNRRLMPRRYRDSLRNVDLVGWAAGLENRIDEYNELQDMFDCPIAEAFSDRRIVLAASPFSNWASGPNSVRFALAQVEVPWSSGQTEEAKRLATIAIDKARHELEAYVESNPEAFRNSHCNAKRRFEIIYESIGAADSLDWLKTPRDPSGGCGDESTETWADAGFFNRAVLLAESELTYNEIAPATSKEHALEAANLALVGLGASKTPDLRAWSLLTDSMSQAGNLDGFNLALDNTGNYAAGRNLATQYDDLGAGDQAGFETPESSLSSAESSVWDTVTFEFNSYEVDADTSFKLDELANNVEGKPDAVLEIIGYTDNKGSPEYNEWLSRRRAEAVKEYLVTMGISPEKLIVNASGSESPVADNTTETGRNANRRVEIVLR